MTFPRKNYFFLFFVILGATVVHNSCNDSGCTNPDADNFDPEADKDDGSCIIYGCINPEADNFNADANTDDGSCVYNCINPEYYCLDITFNHLVDNQNVNFGNNDPSYFNLAQNNYSVRRILYVLSDITLFFVDSTVVLDDFFFINSDLPETLNKTIFDLPGECTGISFRYGFSSIQNIDNNFINEPDNFHLSMLWPNLNGTNDALQGGYHYMKLEGKYIDQNSEVVFYNNHTGPTNSNDFSFLFDTYTFSPSSSISINMNINNWYNNPIYDLDIFGSGIMSNNNAQTIIQQNASDVFTVIPN